MCLILRHDSLRILRWGATLLSTSAIHRAQPIASQRAGGAREVPRGPGHRGACGRAGGRRAGRHAHAHRHRHHAGPSPPTENYANTNTRALTKHARLARARVRAQDVPTNGNTASNASEARGSVQSQPRASGTCVRSHAKGRATRCRSALPSEPRPPAPHAQVARRGSRCPRSPGPGPAPGPHDGAPPRRETAGSSLRLLQPMGILL